MNSFENNQGPSQSHSLGHLVIFDLTKLGTAYQIINSFVDDSSIRVFEISPIGERAVLILVSNDLIALQIAHNQSLSLCRSDILNSEFVTDISENVISAYLSQNQTKVKKSLLVIEEQLFSRSFSVASTLVTEQIEIVDFRVVRTCPPNIIITATDDSAAKLNQIMQENAFDRATIIENVQKPLLSYFEIVK